MIVSDLTGRVFGELRVLYRVSNNKDGSARWLCECSCGIKKSIRAQCLVRGDTRSCTCLQRRLLREKTLKPKGHAGFIQALCTYRSNASRLHRSWELSDDQVRTLFEQNCSYCGSVPMNSRGDSEHSNYKYTGIDRVDSDKGYTIDNVVSCCKRCNRAKDERSLDEFIAWIKSVYDYMELSQ